MPLKIEIHFIIGSDQRGCNIFEGRKYLQGKKRVEAKVFCDPREIVLDFTGA